MGVTNRGVFCAECGGKLILKREDDNAPFWAHEDTQRKECSE